MKTVLMTDRAWPDTDVEQEILRGAGYELIAGPQTAVTPEVVESLALQAQPSAILTCWSRVSAAAIASSAPLRIVARLGVGLDNIDVLSASERGVWVTNVPDYCVEEVSDHAISMLLAWARGLVPLSAAVRAGRWDPSAARLRRLSSLTVGIIGYGRIGRRTASKLKEWGSRILICDPSAIADPPARSVSFQDILSLSDAVIVHAPLNSSTHHLFDSAALSKMRAGSALINVSRGAIVNTSALITALQNGHIGAAALDVLESEPHVPPELSSLSDAILTPHVAFSSDASLIELRRRACEEVVRVLGGGQPHYPCNSPVRLA